MRKPHQSYYTLWKVPFEEMLTRQYSKSMVPLDSELYSEIEANNIRKQRMMESGASSEKYYIKMIPIENLTFDQILLLNKDALERIKQII